MSATMPDLHLDIEAKRQASALNVPEPVALAMLERGAELAVAGCFKMLNDTREDLAAAKRRANLPD